MEANQGSELALHCVYAPWHALYVLLLSQKMHQ